MAPRTCSYSRQPEDVLVGSLQRVVYNGFNRMLDFYENWVRRSLQRPVLTVGALMLIFVLSFAIYPYVGVAFFPRTDAGQFTINMKAPTGSRIELTNDYVGQVEKLIRQSVRPGDFKMTVSNIGDR